jgi:hypothetical protein
MKWLENAMEEKQEECCQISPIAKKFADLVARQLAFFS